MDFVDCVVAQSEVMLNKGLWPNHFAPAGPAGTCLPRRGTRLMAVGELQKRDEKTIRIAQLLPTWLSRTVKARTWYDRIPLAGPRSTATGEH